MPFWKRKPEPPQRKSVEQLNAELMLKPGTVQCSEVGCSAATGLSCEYVDRRQRPCSTAWCPEHRAVVDLHVYCRRHAGVVSALPSTGSSTTMPLPDLDNRAPSLVAWVARQVDSDVWRMMLRELDAAGGGQLLADPVSLVFVGVERRRAWERAWKLATHEGEKRRVAIIVEEYADSEVGVKVGAHIVERLVPPWIGHRRDHETVTPEQDAAERAAFNQRILDAVAAGLERERELARRLTRMTGVPILEVGEVS